MTTRCRIGDMAHVARNTTGCGCTEATMGSIVYCCTPIVLSVGPCWLLRRPKPCPNCGFPVFGYLDADLDPIRPPAPDVPDAEVNPLERSVA